MSDDNATRYATVEQVSAGFRELDSDETDRANALLAEAAVIIDSYAPDADAEMKQVVSCRMVRRAIGSGDDISIPLGATQGSMSALGYSQSWTIGGGTGAVGELYITKAEKMMLGLGEKIGASNPLERMC